MTDGIIKIDSGRARRFGFTSDKFDSSSYLWKQGDWIYISFIMSREAGHGYANELLNSIEDQNFRIFVPTPFAGMVHICEKRGMKLTSRGIGPDYVEGYESVGWKTYTEGTKPE